MRLPKGIEYIHRKVVTNGSFRAIKIAQSALDIEGMVEAKECIEKLYECCLHDYYSSPRSAQTGFTGWNKDYLTGNLECLPKWIAEVEACHATKALLEICPVSISKLTALKMVYDDYGLARMDTELLALQRLYKRQIC